MGEMSVSAGVDSANWASAGADRANEKAEDALRLARALRNENTGLLVRVTELEKWKSEKEAELTGSVFSARVQDYEKRIADELRGEIKKLGDTLRIEFGKKLSDIASMLTSHMRNDRMPGSTSDQNAANDPSDYGWTGPKRDGGHKGQAQSYAEAVRKVQEENAANDGNEWMGRTKYAEQHAAAEKGWNALHKAAGHRIEPSENPLARAKEYIGDYAEAVRKVQAEDRRKEASRIDEIYRSIESPFGPTEEATEADRAAWLKAHPNAFVPAVQEENAAKEKAEKEQHAKSMRETCLHIYWHYYSQGAECETCAADFRNEGELLRSRAENQDRLKKITADVDEQPKTYVPDLCGTCGQPKETDDKYGRECPGCGRTRSNKWSFTGPLAPKCSTCNDTGEVDETLGEEPTSDPHAPCPDCVDVRMKDGSRHKPSGPVPCRFCKTLPRRAFDAAFWFCEYDGCKVTGPYHDPDASKWNAMMGPCSNCGGGVP